MFKFFCTLLLFIFSVSSCYSNSVLTDNQAIAEMMRAGVPFAAIKEARLAQTKETIQNLILAAAPVYPLARILELYPHEVSSSSTTEAQTGESAFYRDCTKDLFLYEKFFLSLAGRYLEATNPLRNLLELTFTDNYRASHGVVQKKNFKIENVKHLVFHIYFICFEAAIKSAPNLGILYKLLESETPLLVSTRHKKFSTQLSQLSRNIRCFAPYFRADLALFVENNLDKALACFQKSLKEIGARDDEQMQILQYYTKYKIAELQLSVYFPKHELLTTKPNPEEGVRALKAFQKVPLMGDLSGVRLGQYYLGFFGGKIQEEKGLSLLKKIASLDTCDHIATVMLAQYYLGETDPDKFDLDKALEYLDKAEKASAKHPYYQEYIRLLRGELALGVFGEASETEIIVDVEKARVAFEADRTHVTDKYLLAIYWGEYGRQFKNDARAAEVFERYKKDYVDYADCHHAMLLYKAGKVDEAVALFEKYQSDVRACYFLGCVKSNPRLLQYYNEGAAINHFYFLLKHGYDFRDTSARFIKLFFKSSGLKPTTGSDQSWRYLIKKITKNDFRFSADELEKNGFIVSDEFKQNLIPTPEEEKLPSPSEDESVAETSTEQGDDNLLRQEVEAIDVEAPILILEDSRLQKLYEDLESKIRWRNLLKFVKEFGGTVDLQKKTMTFPHCKDVFTFHPPHGGNPLIDFTGYWRHLKNMINHEYIEKCKEEAANRN